MSIDNNSAVHKVLRAFFIESIAKVVINDPETKEKLDEDFQNFVEQYRVAKEAAHEAKKM